MPKPILLFLAVALISTATILQAEAQTQRECRITSGIGIAGAMKDSRSVGQYIWLQLDYMLSKNISIATEFENMTYKLPGYFTLLPPGLDDRKCIDNNFSLLFKYHILTKSPLKVAVASGWTYTIRANEFYIYESNGPSQHWYRNVTSFDDYEIPVLLELEYPLWKKINAQARIKCNLNPQNGSTFSTGAGLSLKL